MKNQKPELARLYLLGWILKDEFDPKNQGVEFRKTGGIGEQGNQVISHKTAKALVADIGSQSVAKIVDPVVLVIPEVLLASFLMVNDPCIGGESVAKISSRIKIEFFPAVGITDGEWYSEVTNRKLGF